MNGCKEIITAAITAAQFEGEKMNDMLCKLCGKRKGGTMKAKDKAHHNAHCIPLLKGKTVKRAARAVLGVNQIGKLANHIISND